MTEMAEKAENFCLYDLGVKCPENQSISGWEHKCRTCSIFEALKDGKGCMSIEW